ncbi:hypothetical protein UFOVP98_13 [uncultured Caudovirales phage]|uniref:Uncharacterized protein n=1 Tax=uncultured Caudovirales phage TaxID=2100421 RepID=A0A6J5LN29_9CAUD|nr:hypothetical protein UFOVP98_13 [uncultured Caudovirales phage]CAB4134437.1 hypothetical protein UFOVP269_57 [uncultured Caudovirales phage]
MSNFQTFALITEGNISTAPSTFTGSTSDSLGTVTTTGYLNDLGNDGKIKANDLIYVNYSDTSVFPLNTGLSALLGIFQVTYSSPNWSATQLTPLTELSASVAITAAQFNGAYAAPVELVSAPGSNKLLVLDSLSLVMTYGSADYAAGGVVAVQWGDTVDGAGVIASTTLAAADFFAAASTVFQFNRGVVPAPFSTTVDQGLYLSNVTQPFTTGDSTFVANLNYHVVATA